MSDAEVTMLDRCTGRQLKELLALASRPQITAKPLAEPRLRSSGSHSLLHPASPEAQLASDDTKVTRNWLLEIGNLDRLEALLLAVRKTGKSYLRDVCCVDTPVQTLVEIKSAAKRFTIEAEGPAQKAAATLLYHLSVAAALGSHGRNISSRDPSERLALYQDLAAELSGQELAAIFKKAVAAISSQS